MVDFILFFGHDELLVIEVFLLDWLIENQEAGKLALFHLYIGLRGKSYILRHFFEDIFGFVFEVFLKRNIDNVLESRRLSFLQKVPCGLQLVGLLLDMIGVQILD